MIKYYEVIKFLDKAIEAKKMSAISLGIYHKGVTNIYNFGSTKYNVEYKINDDTIYDLASLTKPVVTTTLVLKMMELGFISLKTKISEYVLGFPYEDISVVDVLTHTSGFCSDDKYYKKSRDANELREFILTRNRIFFPGEKVEYSDMGFVVLGFLIEEILGGLDFAARKYIFEPLSMDNTMFNPLERMPNSNNIVATEFQKKRGMICGEVHDGKSHLLNGVSGNAGCFSTARDLILFTEMLMDKNETVLSLSSKNLLHKYYTKDLNINRTLGWLKEDDSCDYGDYANYDCLFHTGFTGTSIYVDFKRECSIVLLTNRVHPSRDNDSIQSIRNITHNLVLKTIDSEEVNL